LNQSVEGKKKEEKLGWMSKAVDQRPTVEGQMSKAKGRRPKVEKRKKKKRKKKSENLLRTRKTENRI
jgi:hypothetical protein